MKANIRQALKWFCVCIIFTKCHIFLSCCICAICVKGLIWDQLFRLKKTVTLESIQDIAWHFVDMAAILFYDSLGYIRVQLGEVNMATIPPI